LVANPKSKASLLAAWKEVMANNTIISWNKKLSKGNRAIRAKSEELIKIQKVQWKEKYQAQFVMINAAEKELLNNWGLREARDCLSEAQSILHEVRQQRFQFQECASLSNWS
jgi:hypothetical protein